MVKAQYASGRQQICPVVPALTAGNLTAQTYYFWIQGRNDVGYNLPSTEATVTSVGGDGISLTIVADCYRTGENWQQFVISANTVNDNNSSTVIAVLDAVDPITQAPITLPKVHTISEDAHIDLSRVAVATFPTGADLVEGMVREYSVTGLLYRYDPDSTATPNGTTVIAATVGNWVQYVDDFNITVTDTENLINGCDVPILDIVDNSKVLPLRYALDGSKGQFRRLWLVNDNSTANIPKGERVGFVLTVNGQTASEDFEGLLKVVFEGLSDTTTGILDTLEDDLITPLEDVGVEKPYTFEASDLIIAKDIEPGETWQCRVFPEFNSFQLRNLPSYLANIAAFPFIFPEAGTYNDASAIIGNAILPDPDTLRRAYPSTGLELFVDEGSGTVGGFFFNNKASVNVTNLDADTASQILVINNNGEVYMDDAIQSFEDQRALISTAQGESHAGGYSTAVTADGSPNLDVTVVYPSLIRADFDDVIAGSDKGTFNAEEVILFVRQNGTEIRRFDGFIPTNTTSDVFQAVWSSGAVVGSINSTLFGFWTPATPTTVIASTAGTDTYEVAVSFAYLGNSVTDIDHSVTVGSIQELDSTILALLESNRYWQVPRATRTQLAAIPSADLLAYEVRLTYETEDSLDVWVWVPTSSDNTGNSVRPDDILLANSGRWLRTNNRSWQDPVSTYNNLTALPSADLAEYEVRVVFENDPPEFWTYDPTSLDNTPVISLRPDDTLIGDPGRWLVSGGSGSVNVTFALSNPTTTPTVANELYVNEADKFSFISKDITSPNDWIPITFEPERIVVFGGEVVTYQGEVVYVQDPGTPYTGPTDPLGFPTQDGGVEVTDNTQTLNFVGASSVTESGGVVTVDVTTAGTTVEVQDEGVNVVSGVTVINFTGPNVSATNPSGTTVDVTLTDADTGHVIEDETVALTQRSALNFTGLGVTVTDNAGNDASDVTIPGYTDEEAQDAVGTILEGTPTVGDVEFAYDDGTPLISAKARVTSRATGNLETLAADKTLAVDDPYYHVLDGQTTDRNVNLYAGGSVFRHHFILNSGTTNALDVRNESAVVLSNLAPGEQAMVFWDTTQWRLI